MARFIALFARACAPHPAAGATPGRLPEALGGPGWFDSSWDLQRGLEVREGLPEDAKLQEWIESFCLRAQPAGSLAAV